MISGSRTPSAAPKRGEPDRDPLFPQPLLDALAANPDRIAFEHGSRRVSYSELLEMVRGFVDGMREAGLGPGRGVAMLTGITPEAFAANVAAHALGGLVVGIRPGWSTSQLASVLADGMDAVVGDPSTLTPEVLGLADPAVVLSLGAHHGAIDLLAQTGTAGQADLLARADTPDRDTSSHQPKPTPTTNQPDRTGRTDQGDRTGSAGGGGPIMVEARPDDVARLNFTSGSTGRPKGCARTYRTFSLAYQPDRWAPDLARLVTRFERYLVHNIFSVPVVLTFTARCLTTGGTAVIPDEDPRPRMPYAIERHGITGIVMTVPTLHRTIAQLRDDPVDLGCLRALVVTGSPASPGLLATAVELLGPVVWQGYGQAESGMISLLTPEDIARDRDAALASVGRPLPDVEISVRDQDNRPVGPGKSGEICVRSPQMMSGYWGEPPGTSEVLGEDGWLHTRDLGYLDETSGLLQLTGRGRDVIIVNAEVCYAGAIEQVLARHPKVDQAYVVGVPDEQTGEAIHAFIVPASDPGSPNQGLDTDHGADHDDDHKALDPEELAHLVRSELSTNHVPVTFTLISEVPAAASGKPDKEALAKQVSRSDVDEGAPTPKQ